MAQSLIERLMGNPPGLIKKGDTVKFRRPHPTKGYVFNVTSKEAIDFSEIASNLTHEIPAIVVHVQEHYLAVLISSHIMRKRDALNLELPEGVPIEGVLNDNHWMCIVHSPKEVNLITKWVKYVQNHPWGELKCECKVTVNFVYT